VIASAIRRSRAGISSTKRPLGSFIFLGPTGVGKTLLAKTLAKFLFGTEESLVRIDMSDYMEKHNASRLVGAPPGYIGFEEGGVLTEKIRRNPYSVILLDEIEKAHPDVFNLLLQVLGEGELQDNLGHTINFRNTVIIMTSNAGARVISRENRLGFSNGDDGILDYEEIRSGAMSELKRIFNPEFINRVDEIVVFTALTRGEVSSILDIQIAELSSRLAEQRILLVLRPAARNYLVEHGYEPSFGARPMRRLIQREIEDSLSLLIISGALVSGDTVRIDSRDGKIVLRVKKPRVALIDADSPAATRNTELAEIPEAEEPSYPKRS
jgi:ATP-dependent Clp protease ATP-binding subunit ClpC